MATSAYQQLEYDTSKPVSYEQWREEAASKYYNTGSFGGDFWKGFSEWWRFLNPNDPYIGRQGYQDYVDDFYQKQGTKNAEISEKNQRAYEEYMSSTAYQRAYEDIKKTGLNPAMLISYLNPASTPSSATNFQRNTNQSSSRSSSEGNNRNNSATAVIAALLFLIAKIAI